MSIEQDWKWLFDYEFFDSPGCLGKQLRCMFDLRDRLKRVEQRLDSIQSDVDVALDAVIEKEQPDPSEWVRRIDEIIVSLRKAIFQYGPVEKALRHASSDKKDAYRSQEGGQERSFHPRY